MEQSAVVLQRALRMLVDARLLVCFTQLRMPAPPGGSASPHASAEFGAAVDGMLSAISALLVAKEARAVATRLVPRGGGKAGTKEEAMAALRCVRVSLQPAARTPAHADRLARVQPRSNRTAHGVWHLHPTAACLYGCVAARMAREARGARRCGERRRRRGERKWKQ